MQNRKLIIAIIVLIVVAVGWYLFRPELLFIDKTVNEEFPGGPAMASIEKGPMVITHGNFKGLAHETKGTAAVYQLPDGRRTLRLTGFETSNGPDVHVYLVAAPEANDNETVKSAGFIDLGSLKGNVGDQNYDVPAEVDLSKHRSVSIWCARFSVNFGSASLSEPMVVPTKLAEGTFHGVAHETKGIASIYRLPEGKRVLRFSGFETSNGPDVQVYLVAAPDAKDNETVTNAGFIHVGALKGNVGDQNYDLPADVDLGKYRSVTIWCRRFGVNFATAPLTAQQG